MMAPNGSVDPAEIARFGALGEDWWDLEGPMRALHKFNPVRVGWIRDRAATHFPRSDGAVRDLQSAKPLIGLEILDIGCGAGILCEPMARLGARVVGVDPAARNIDIARAHAESTGLDIDYRSQSAEDLVAAGASFDVVLAMEVIEHVVNPRAFIASACKLTRPGGLLFLATLNRTLKSYALGIVAAEYILCWVPRGTHRWEKFITPQELRDWLRPCGFSIEAAAGVTFNPLANEWRQSRDMDVNYMIVAGGAGAAKDAP